MTKTLTPKKPEDGKKRVADTSLKTPASDKKAKIATPSGQTTEEGSSCGNSSSCNADQQGAWEQRQQAKGEVPQIRQHPRLKSPKSGSTHACKSCSRTFGSDAALQFHEKAKHGLAARGDNMRRVIGC